MKPILTAGMAFCSREGCPEWRGQLGLSLPGLDTSAGMGCRLLGLAQTGDGSCEPYYASHQDPHMFPAEAGIWERLEAAEEIAAKRVIRKPGT